jgi:hypothetical protein
MGNTANSRIARGAGGIAHGAEEILLLGGIPSLEQ